MKNCSRYQVSGFKLKDQKWQILFSHADTNPQQMNTVAIGKRAKLRTVAASNNTDHPTR